MAVTYKDVKDKLSPSPSSAPQTNTSSGSQNTAAASVHPGGTITYNDIKGKLSGNAVDVSSQRTAATGYDNGNQKFINDYINKYKSQYSTDKAAYESAQKDLNWLDKLIGNTATRDEAKKKMEASQSDYFNALAATNRGGSWIEGYQDYMNSMSAASKQQQENSIWYTKERASGKSSEQIHTDASRNYTDAVNAFKSAQQYYNTVKADPSMDTAEAEKQVNEAQKRMTQAQLQLSYANQNRFDYSSISKQKDFKEAVAKGEAITKSQDKTYFDPYELTDAADRIRKQDEALSKPQEGWTQNQLNTYNYYLGRGDAEMAKNYAYTINETSNYQKLQEQKERVGTWATDSALNAALASAGTVAGQVAGLSTVDYLDSALQYAMTGRIATEADLNATQMSSTIRGSIAEDLNKKSGTIKDGIPIFGGTGAGDAYQLAMSIADSLAAAKAPVGLMGATAGEIYSLSTFFGSAASNGIYDALEKGATPGQALAIGTLNGAAEVLGEKFSIEGLINMKAGTGNKNTLKQVLIQGGVEGSEEGFTTLVNTISDLIINGDKSELNTLLQEYMNQGMSYSDAQKAAIKDWVNGLGQDIVGGMISGGVSGIANIAGGTIKSKLTNYDGDLTDLRDQANLLGEDNELSGKANTLYEKAQSGPVKEYDVIRLANQVKEAIETADNAKLKEAVTKQLEAYGEEGDLSKKADTLIKALRDEDFRVREENGKIAGITTLNMAVNNITNGRRILSEMVSAMDENTGDTNAWVKDIGTNVYGGKSMSARITEPRQRSFETIKDNSGTTIDLADIDSGVRYNEDTKQLEVTVKTPEGNTLVRTQEDLSLTPSQSFAMKVMAKLLGADSAAAFSVFDAQQDPEAFSVAFKRAIDHASTSNISLDRMKQNRHFSYKGLDLDQLEIAYSIGHNRYEQKKADVKQAESTEGKKTGTGSVQLKEFTTTFLKHGKKTTRTFKAASMESIRADAKKSAFYDAISKLASISGITFNFYEGDVGRNVNGMFDPKTNEVWININAANRNTGKSLLMKTLSHELTHYIQANNPAGYEELKDFVIDQILKYDNRTYELRLHQLMTRQGLTAEQAIDEMVANGCENMLQNSAAIETMARDHADLFEDIKAFVMDFTDKVKAAIKGVGKGDTIEGNILGYNKELQKKWDTSFVDAARNGSDADLSQRSGRQQHSFAGIEAATADFGSLSDAEEMESYGADPEQIRQETGWFRGMDNKWRFEIDDSKTKWRRQGDLVQMKSDSEYAKYLRIMNEFLYGTVSEEDRKQLLELDKKYHGQALAGDTLESFLDYDEIYEAYPFLRNVKISTYYNENASEKGAWLRNSNEIRLNLAKLTTDEETRSTVLHEVQHAIQEREGFAGGSNTEYWEREKRKRNAENQETIDKIKDDLQKALDEYYALEDKYKVDEREEEIMEEFFDEMIDYEEAMNRIEEYKNSIPELAKAKKRTEALRKELAAVAGTQRTAVDLYLNTAGEIEARDVQERRNMSAEERKRNAPRKADKDTVFAEDGLEALEIKTIGKHKYVQADRQVLTGSNPKVWGEQITNYIEKQIRKGRDVQIPTTDGDIISITADTSGKSSFRNENEVNGVIKRMSDELYEVKLNAEAHIDELLEISVRGLKNEPDENGIHGEKASLGFNYRTSYFRDFDGKYYKLRISVMENPNSKIAYNIGKLRERTFPNVAGSSTNSGAQSGKGSSGNSITQTNQNNNVSPKNIINNALANNNQNNPMANALRAATQNGQHSMAEESKGGIPWLQIGTKLHDKAISIAEKIAITYEYLDGYDYMDSSNANRTGDEFDYAVTSAYNSLGTVESVEGLISQLQESIDEYEDDPDFEDYVNMASDTVKDLNEWIDIIPTQKFSMAEEDDGGLPFMQRMKQRFSFAEGNSFNHYEDIRELSDNIARLESVRADMMESFDIWQENRIRSRNRKFVKTDVERIVRNQLKLMGFESNSSNEDPVNRDQIVKDIEDYTNWLIEARGDEDSFDFDEATERLLPIVDRIIENCWEVPDTYADDTRRKVESMLRNRTLKIDPAQWGDLGARAEDRRADYGMFRLSQAKGTSLDTFWKDTLNQELPNEFPLSITSQQEMLEQIKKVLNRSSKRMNAFYEMSDAMLEEQRYEYATDILAKLWDVRVKQMAQDNAENNLRQLKEDLQNQRKANEKLLKIIAADEAVYKQAEEMIQKMRQQYSESAADYLREMADRNVRERQLRQEIKDLRNGMEDSRKNQLEAAKESARKKSLKELKEDPQNKSLVDYYEKQLKEQKEKSDQRRKDFRDRRENTEIRNRIKRLVSDMNHRLQHPTEKKHVPIELTKSVVEVLEAIDLDSGRSINLYNKLSKIRDNYAKLMADETYGAAAYDDMIKGMLDSMVEAIPEDLSVYDMNREQLEIVYKTMRSLDHYVRNAVNVTLAGKERAAYDIAMDMIKETNAIEKPRENIMTMWLQTQLTPARMFERLGGFKKNSTWSKVYRMMDEAQLLQTQIMMEGSEIFKGLIENGKGGFRKEYYELTNYDEKKLVDVGLKDENGKSVKITRGMMLSLYMHLLNDDNARHVGRGGITIPNIKDYYKGTGVGAGFGFGSVRCPGFSAQISEANHKLSEAQKSENQAEIQARQQDLFDLYDQSTQYVTMLQARLYKMMTPYERQWIKATQRLMDGYSKQRLNETTMKVYGIKKAVVENYFPIKTDSKFINAPFESIAHDFSLENVGYMKERTKGSNPILLEDITRVCNNQINNVSRYCGLMPAVKDFNKIFGKTQSGFRDTIQTAVVRKFGNSGVKYIENLMADLNGARKTEESPFAEALNHLRGNMAQATLTLSVRTALGQTASYPTAAAVLGWDPLRKALLKGGKDGRIISRADQELIRKYSPLLYYRLKGFNTIEMGDMKETNSKQAQIWRKLSWATGWINAMDGATVGRLWYAAEYYIDAKQPQLKKGTDEYYKEVAKIFNETIEKTQPNYTTLQRPDILRNPNAMVRNLTMFLTQRLQNFNILYESAARYTQYKKDFQNRKNGVTEADVKEAAQQTRNAVVSQVVASGTIVAFKIFADLLQHSMNAYRDDDKELTAESVSMEALNMFLDAITGNMLLGSEIYDYFGSKAFGNTYYGIEVSAISNVTDLVKATDNFVKACWDKENHGPEKTQKILNQGNNLAKQLSLIVGMPLSNAEKIFKGIFYHAEDLMNGEFLSFEAGVDRSKTQDVHRYYEAIRSGDKAKAEKILAEYAEDSKLKKNFDSDLKSLVGEMYVGKQLSKADAESFLVNYCGLTKNDASTTVLKWTSELVTGIKFGNIKQAFMDDEITASRAVEMLKKYGGKADEDARETVKKYQCEKDTGIAYDDIKSNLLNGSISTTKAAQMWHKYGGVEDAQLKAEYTVFKNENPNMNISDTLFKKYQNTVAPTGASIDLLDEVKRTSDTNGNGKLTNAEIGTVLKAKYKNGEITLDQASAIWDVLKSASTKSTFKQWAKIR